MIAAPPSAGNRGRKAVTAPSQSSVELIVWRFFAKRFEETYGSACPWNGQGVSWPTKGNPFAASGRAPWDGTFLPRAEDNGAALARIVELAKGDTSEALHRIDRIFHNKGVASIGISLALIAHWWDAAGNSAQLLRRSNAVLGSVQRG